MSDLNCVGYVIDFDNTSEKSKMGSHQENYIDFLCMGCTSNFLYTKSMIIHVVALLLNGRV